MGSLGPKVSKHSNLARLADDAAAFIDTSDNDWSSMHAWRRRRFESRGRSGFVGHGSIDASIFLARRDCSWLTHWALYAAIEVGAG